MPSFQLNERKVSTGSSNNNSSNPMHGGTTTHIHHPHLNQSSTPSTVITSSGRPLMINLNHPASTRHSSQSSRTKIPSFFQHKAASSSGGTNSVI